MPMNDANLVGWHFALYQTDPHSESALSHMPIKICGK
jgi:hypothetical protein